MRDTESGRITSAGPSSATSQALCVKWGISPPWRSLLIGGAVYFASYRLPSRALARDTWFLNTTHAVSGQPGVRTVAVLPFRSLSGRHGDEAWGIGMTDAIITRLATLQNLAVRPTSSVLKYVKTPTDPSQAAQELQVDSVVDGTYQRAGAVIRVSVQLIDKQNKSARWAEHYDLRADDMLKFQDAGRKESRGRLAGRSLRQGTTGARSTADFIAAGLQPVSTGALLPQRLLHAHAGGEPAQRPATGEGRDREGSEIRGSVCAALHALCDRKRKHFRERRGESRAPAKRRRGRGSP